MPFLIAAVVGGIASIGIDRAVFGRTGNQTLAGLVGFGSGFATAIFVMRLVGKK